MKNTIAQLYADYQSGKQLSNRELQMLHDHMEQLASLANVAGPVFRLAGLEARRVAMGVFEFLRERNRKW